MSLIVVFHFVYKQNIHTHRQCRKKHFKTYLKLKRIKKKVFKILLLGKILLSNASDEFNYETVINSS